MTSSEGLYLSKSVSFTCHWMDNMCDAIICINIVFCRLLAYVALVSAYNMLNPFYYYWFMCHSWNGTLWTYVFGSSLNSAIRVYCTLYHISHFYLLLFCLVGTIILIIIIYILCIVQQCMIFSQYHGLVSILVPV